MVKNVTLGEELVVTGKNKPGFLSDISIMLANAGINIEAAAGFTEGDTAKIMLITSANLGMIHELRKAGYKDVEETEVVMVDLENKPGAIKIVTTELAAKGIDIKYHYVTTCSCGGASRLVMSTSDNEAAMALLSKFL